MNARLIVAAHKIYPMPTDPLYLPLQVGAAGKPPLQVGAVGKPPLQEGFLRDDAGENISEKNPCFCELTGLYWAWKNLDADAYGLVHYRRYFGEKRPSGRTREKRLLAALSSEKAEELLSVADMILPKKRHYVIETLESHYAHTMGADHLTKAREIIAELYPQDITYADRAYRMRSGHMFNMFLMKREYADAYLSWLFPILFRLEERIDTDGLSDFHRRLFGRVSEVLFNAWILKITEEKHPVIKELPVFSAEPENMLKKGCAFLRAKFFRHRYEESF